MLSLLEDLVGSHGVIITDASGIKYTLKWSAPLPPNVRIRVGQELSVVLFKMGDQRCFGNKAVIVEGQGEEVQILVLGGGKPVRITPQCWKSF